MSTGLHRRPEQYQLLHRPVCSWSSLPAHEAHLKNSPDRVEAVLVSRFLLDLQAASRRTLKLSRSDPLNFGTTWTDGGDNDNGSLSFARVIGSLGSSIDRSSSEGSTETMYGDGVPSEEFELKTPVRETANNDAEHAPIAPA